jgi:hypothetical protein
MDCCRHRNHMFYGSPSLGVLLSVWLNRTDSYAVRIHWKRQKKSEILSEFFAPCMYFQTIFYYVFTSIGYHNDHIKHSAVFTFWIVSLFYSFLPFLVLLLPYAASGRPFLTFCDCLNRKLHTGNFNAPFPANVLIYLLYNDTFPYISVLNISSLLEDVTQPRLIDPDVSNYAM